MISQRLKEFLEKNGVDYKVVPHPESWSSEQIARNEHLTDKEVAKVAIVKAGIEDVMVVIPSSSEIDLKKLKEVLDTEYIALESQKDFAELFPDCDPSALPAIGEPYDIPCYVDETLLDGGDVYFDGGNHKDGVKMTSDEYWRISQAEVGDFRVRHKKPE